MKASTSFVGFTNYSIEGKGATKLRQFILDGGQFLLATPPDLADLVPFVKNQNGETVGQWSAASERLQRLVKLHRLDDDGGDFDLKSKWYREVKPVGRDLPGHGNDAPRSLVKITDKSAFPASKSRKIKQVKRTDPDFLERKSKSKPTTKEAAADKKESNTTRTQLARAYNNLDSHFESPLTTLMLVAGEAKPVATTRSTNSHATIAAAAARAVFEAKKATAAATAPPKVTRCIINRRTPTALLSAEPTQPKALSVQLPRGGSVWPPQVSPPNASMVRAKVHSSDGDVQMRDAKS